MVCLTDRHRVCICLHLGVLTQASKDNIVAAVEASANAQVVGQLTTAVGAYAAPFASQNAIVALLEQQALANVGGMKSNCNYPTGSTPDSCTDCHSSCPDGQYVCGNACISDNDGCSSGQAVPPKKRDFLSVITTPRCPSMLTACAVPASSFFTGRNFECLDVMSDIESCGACTFPLPGEKSGIDCTSIPHTLGVKCHLGKCVIDSCQQGFELSTDGAKCVPGNKRILKEKRRTAKNAIKSRQVKTADLRGRR
ncbi:hypothetical protein BD324DRAFT_170815 [Kockovaella imperatae]|uniref:Protein CPL1-like domain-containing protein n=1 Tax=Kockovaella imperatae TaxID=4999 RepID=A0A1Y1UAU0_9TREE|nr:hypothetical protein BD324DRAFT_170815 [Kockovaella imperatae]ORX34195.1 hypothetical protein BD324DRAFT_170815 [Kockovaella imperatae]